MCAPSTKCDLCDSPFHKDDKVVKISEKAANTINASSRERGLEIVVVPGQEIHTNCRRIFTDKKNIKAVKISKEKSQDIIRSPTLRSKSPTFRFKTHCILCTYRAVDEDGQHYKNVYRVSTMVCQENMLHCCENRQDEWANDVHSRIVYAQDLPAVDAVYHQSCSVNFRTHRKVPSEYSSIKRETDPTQAGRKIDTVRQATFQQVIDELLENEKEQTTVGEIADRMSELCNDSYSLPYTKKKLVEYFGDTLHISQIDNRPNVVTIKRHVGEIIHKFRIDHQEQDGEAEQKSKIIKAAAALIRSEIDAMQTNRDIYPNISELGERDKHRDFVPDTLLLFLSEIFRGKKTENDLKITSIGHCIMQLARPRTIISPLLFGLTMDLHWEFGSRNLIEKLYEKGFCLSYDEAILFKACAAKHQVDTFPNLEGRFCHFIADNVDHNTITLDGRGTYHGMGLMYTATPAVKISHTISRDITSLEDRPRSLTIREFRRLRKFNETLIYEYLPEIIVDDARRHLDLLWKISYPCKVRSVWPGFMQAITKGDHQGKASFHFLPMVDLDPTNMSCVYSTLVFVNDQCIKYGIQPIVTFDQPLWMKAKLILSQEESLKDLILILGGFHTLMSFLGSICHIMKSSGLSAVLQLVFAENTVTHILSGKAYSRAVRGHFLVDGALNALLLQKVQTNEASQQIVECALRLFDDVSVGLSTSGQDDTIEALDKLFQQIKMDVSLTPTGKLWVQYMETVDILRSTLKAQRTGDFMLYLKSLKDMLPYFAASGHNSYTKSVHLFLQDMLNLEEKNPTVYQEFSSGNLFVRRSDRFWGALPTDLVIEQVLMRALKSKSGLTHGRGMDETQRTRWLLTMPDYARISTEMDKLGSCVPLRGNDIRPSAMIRDHTDTTTVFKYLECHDPFGENEYVYDISTGIASADSNVHIAKDIGESIIASMAGEKMIDYIFKKKNQVKLMGPKIICDGDVLAVDPQLLFQRLLILVSNSHIDLNYVFEYELSVYPTALFRGYGMLNSATKQRLTDGIAKLSNDSQETSIPNAECNVLDGGSLLQRLPWTKGETYKQIVGTYVKMVSNYVHPIVVFDGYKKCKSTKAVTHQKRARGKRSTPVRISMDLPLMVDKESFLSNNLNKQNFIDMLSDEMRKNNIKTIHAEDDADLLIVQTSISLAMEKRTFVIAEDTDILVLLCHYYKPGMSLYMKSEKVSIKRSFWNLKTTCAALGEKLCQNLPFLHALSGCDTTSGLHGIGKGSVLDPKKFNELMEIGENFRSSTATREDIRKFGEKALVSLYGGGSNNLNSLRRKKFGNKAMNSIKCVDIQRLPPTEDAAKYHSYRVYLQTQVWLGNHELAPGDWGWKVNCGRLIPQTMDNKPVPDALLKIIHCKCKTYCGTMSCSCKRNGLFCSDYCGKCQDGLCSNIPLDEVDYQQED